MADFDGNRRSLISIGVSVVVMQALGSSVSSQNAMAKE